MTIGSSMQMESVQMNTKEERDLRNAIEQAEKIENKWEYLILSLSTAKGYLSRYTNPPRGRSDVFDPREYQRVLWNLKNSMINEV